MPYPNEHSCRLQDPGKYRRFNRQNCARKVDDKCLDVVYGIIATNKSEEQAYRYNKDVWTEDSARNHCTKHNGKFEAASTEKH